MKRFKNLDLGASKYEVTALGVKGYKKNVTIRGPPGEGVNSPKLCDVIYE